MSVSLILPGGATGGACAAFDVRVPAGAGLPPHVRRDHDAALLVLAGRVVVVCGHGRTELTTGGTMSLPRGAACRVDATEDARMLVFALPAAFEDLVDGATDTDDLMALLSVAGISLLPARWGDGA